MQHLAAPFCSFQRMCSLVDLDMISQFSEVLLGALQWIQLSLTVAGLF